MPRDFTDITILLDRSGSMSAIQDGTIKGINDFIREQRDVPGDGCWSLIQFDHLYEPVYIARAQHDVPLLTPETYKPRGDTAYFDAACRVIDETGQRLAALPEHLRPSRVLIVVMTDGFENNSKHHTLNDMNVRIAHQQQKYGWKFVYLGANQDAVKVADGYGISRGHAKTYAYNNAGASGVLHCLSAGTRGWKTDGTSPEFFTEPQPDLPDTKVNVQISVGSGSN